MAFPLCVLCASVVNVFIEPTHVPDRTHRRRAARPPGQGGSHGRGHHRRLPRRRSATATRQVKAFLHVDEDAARSRPRRWTRSASRASRSARWPACRSRSRTSSARKGVPTTCSSKILQNFVPPYDAHVVERLQGRGRGPDRQDEHGRVRHGLVHREQRLRVDPQPVGPGPHPRRLVRRLGGGGGGVRGPASPWAPTPAGPSASRPPVRDRRPEADLRPRVSRYGLVAFASSLDQVGPFAHDVADAALMLEVIAGHDDRDSTSVDRPVPDYTQDASTTRSSR